MTLIYSTKQAQYLKVKPVSTGAKFLFSNLVISFFFQSDWQNQICLWLGGPDITHILILQRMPFLLSFVRHWISCSRKLQQDPWLLMNKVATNLQPLDNDHITSPPINYVSCEIDARVVPVVVSVVSVWKMLNSKMKTPIVQWQTIANFTLAQVGILYNLKVPPNHTAVSFPDSVGRVRQICFS